MYCREETHGFFVGRKIHLPSGEGFLQQIPPVQAVGIADGLHLSGQFPAGCGKGNCICAAQIGKQLGEEGIACDILKLNRITPIGCEVVNLASSYSAVLFAEEGILNGGIAQQMLSHMHAAGFSGSARIHAIENGIVKQSSVSRQLELLKLDSASLYQSAKEMLV